MFGISMSHLAMSFQKTNLTILLSNNHNVLKAQKKTLEQVFFIGKFLLYYI
jgi:hypothetical protein